MPKAAPSLPDLAQSFTAELQRLRAARNAALDDETLATLLAARDALVAAITELRPDRSPPELTLGRPDGIARFFAFCFANREKRRMTDLDQLKTYGSGVYAIYYHGDSHPAYSPISGTETPIYVGKADSDQPFALTPEQQGKSLITRLKEHKKSITRAANLDVGDFWFRHAVVQSGMQSAVEAFMIQIFKPIWNKETKICYGIGKHGDSASTRKNKRSPWDTMHPGRAWAADTSEDQRQRHQVEADIAAHFSKHRIIPTKDALLAQLAV